MKLEADHSPHRGGCMKLKLEADHVSSGDSETKQVDRSGQGAEAGVAPDTRKSHDTQQGSRLSPLMTEAAEAQDT